MALSTSTSTLAAGASRTFNLSPGSALTLVAPPNVRATVTETPNTVSASDVGGNASRTHNLQMVQTVTYGPYPMGGTVVVANASNSGATITWVRSDSIVAESAAGAVSLVDGAGNFLSSVNRAPLGLLLTTSDLSGTVATVGAGATLNSSAQSVFDGEPVWCVSVTATAGTNNYVELAAPLQSQEFSAADITAEFAISAYSSISGAVIYLGSAGYSKFAAYTFNSEFLPSTNATWALNDRMTAYQAHETQLAAGKSGFSDEVGNQSWVNAKLRIYITNGQTVTIYLRAIVAGAAKKKARLAFVSDDGYKSFIAMGVPVFEEFGFKSSIAVIPEAVGSAECATLSDLQRYVAKGNECIAHGPNDGNGGTGSLWTTYTTNAQRIADINRARDYLIANGLCTSWGAKCYVWPQGRYAESTSDYAMLDLMLDNGYTLGRAANRPLVKYYHKLNALGQRNRARLITPVIGHTFGDESPEATNIATVNARITALGASRMDGTVMLHRVVGVDAANVDTKISVNQLRAILTNARTEVDADRMEVVLYSDFARA